MPPNKIIIMSEFGGKGKFTLPENHKPFMKVPAGGSSCANCLFLSECGKHCTNKHFIEWYGSSELPTPVSEYCSDWYEPKNATESKQPGGEITDEPHTNGGCDMKHGEKTYNLEGNEVIINKTSMKDKDVYEVTGNPHQIASAINELGGGVKFDDGATIRKVMALGGTIPKKRQLEVNEKVKDLITRKGTDRSQYSADELALLALFEGAGGLDKSGAGILDQFFTPDFIVEKMFEIAYKNGFTKEGKVLEPASGSGRFIKHAPVQKNVTAFEKDALPWAVSRVLYPEAKIYDGFFETAFMQPPRFTSRIPESKLTWLEGYPFDLTIGNPPYGKHSNEYRIYFTKPKFPSIEFMFMYYGAKLLKKDGLLIFITSSSFMRNGSTYDESKKELFKITTFVESYRMPNGIFANTEVGTDIIVLRKK